MNDERLNGLVISSLRSSSPFGGVLEKSRESRTRKETGVRGRVVSRFGSLAITGELAGRQGHYNEKNDVTLELKLLHTTKVLWKKV